MIYCISDIHGEYERYIAMLNLIGFSDDDTLYVLGDVIDRGKQGIEILLDIMKRPNVFMITGNHEQMCLATLGHNNEIGARHLWQQNGGSNTYRAMVYGRAKEQRWKIIHFIEKLPDHLEIEVGYRKFHLVHGFPANNKEDRIWGRVEQNSTHDIPNTTVIVGHTPTSFLTGKEDEPLSIWHGNNIIDIDCGCGSKSEYRRLACLRLDDMQEFYVSEFK